MLNVRKTAAVILCCMMMIGAAGCGDDSPSGKKDSGKDKEYSAAEVADDDVLNYTAPKEGEEIAVMTVKDYGEIKFKLFPELCPKGVDNFKQLVEKGYYDGLTFHRVIEDFMIQGGDPEGTGRGGESVWGGSFDGGVTPGLYHFTGALAYANSAGPSTDGSQFYIVTGPESYSDGNAQQYVDAYVQAGINMPDEAVENYKKNGGAWHLDGFAGNYTIFGQVIDGLDVAEEISKVSTGENDKPETDVVIEKITIEEYDGSDVKFTLDDYD